MRTLTRVRVTAPNGATYACTIPGSRAHCMPQTAWVGGSATRTFIPGPAAQGSYLYCWDVLQTFITSRGLPPEAGPATRPSGGWPQAEHFAVSRHAHRFRGNAKHRIDKILDLLLVHIAMYTFEHDERVATPATMQPLTPLWHSTVARCQAGQPFATSIHAHLRPMQSGAFIGAALACRAQSVCTPAECCRVSTVSVLLYIGTRHMGNA
jgi:hypothetical protein